MRRTHNKWNNEQINMYVWELISSKNGIGEMNWESQKSEIE